ncbi:lipoate--protein ligase family protein [Citricoccus sp. SGAir0253]|uniref:lipoate--protein ligase family protein n=1 Tax=Citricoccus sp. SGAir0253 TaxID=2567881 RepID=UPI0010CCFD56|nr:lipoate--protein ligase family protein [Citricoccus sp. SGAir0253]QCU78191.1 lipoate--protein ligase family protein [Citricoccus sp. SGAir0253]
MTERRPPHGEPLHWVHQDASLGAAEDLDHGLTLLRGVQSGAAPAPLVRLYRPAPTVAFGQRDARLPGFERARQACRAHGFAPVVRRAGGRAAAYHPGSLVVDHLERDAEAMRGFRERFAAFGGLFVEVFRAAGVPAAVGEVPGEYCPGEFSVHTPLPAAADGTARTPVKLAGTAQRVVKGAWLFSSSLVVEDPGPVRAVLVDVYEALGLDWDPDTAGAASDAVPGLTVEDVAAGLRRTYARHASAAGGIVDRDWAQLLGAVPAASAPAAG